MTEQQKTLSFVAVAAVMAAAGVFLAPKGPTLPKDSTEALIGTEFYKDFKNPSDATAIEVISYDPSTATASVFGVENQNGVWRIPSRHGYPADEHGRAELPRCRRHRRARRPGSTSGYRVAFDPRSLRPDGRAGHCLTHR